MKAFMEEYGVIVIVAIIIMIFIAAAPIVGNALNNSSKGFVENTAGNMIGRPGDTGGGTEDDGTFSVSWDGNTDGLTEVDATDFFGCKYYKVSSQVPTYDELYNYGILSANGEMDGEYFEESYPCHDMMYAPLNDGFISISEIVIIVPTDNYTYDSLSFAEKGTYFVKEDGLTISLTIDKTLHGVYFNQKYYSSSETSQFWVIFQADGTCNITMGWNENGYNQNKTSADRDSGGTTYEEYLEKGLESASFTDTKYTNFRITLSNGTIFSIQDNGKTLVDEKGATYTLVE